MPYADIGLKPRRYDPQQAKALLENAGWVLPAGKDIREKNGQPLHVELSFIGTDALSKSMAEIIQADMRQIGVDVALVGEGREQYLCPPARWSLRHDFQPYLGRTLRSARLYEFDARAVARRFSGATGISRQTDY